jgi:hypothetical protein
MSLFFLQNVFNQEVYKEKRYVLSESVISHLEKQGVEMAKFRSLKDQEVAGGVHFRDLLREQDTLDGKMEDKIISTAELFPLHVTEVRLRNLDRGYLTAAQSAAVERLVNSQFQHRWQLDDALSQLSPEWKRKEDNKLNKPFNKHLKEQLAYLHGLFEASDGE